MTNNDSWWSIGTYDAKFPENTGTLWRSAQAFGANHIFTIGERYKRRMSDTRRAWQTIPLFQFGDFDSFLNCFPKGAALIGIEISEKSKPLTTFRHPLRAVYLLGAEDTGLPMEVQRKCDAIIEIPHASHCLNVSVAGSILAYDRIEKIGRGEFEREGQYKMR